MDLLGRLLGLMPVSGHLDIRCHFGAPWQIRQKRAGLLEIPYHVLLSGQAVLEDDNGPPQLLSAGDIVLFPGGSAHRLHDGSGKKAKPVSQRQTATLMVEENRGTGASVDLLCGCFVLAAAQDRLLRDHLPERLVLNTGMAEPAAVDAHELPNGPTEAMSLARLVQLMRDEAEGERPGGRELLNYLSGALFTLTMRYASESDAPPRGLLALAQQPRLQPALAAMFDAPQHPWTLPSLAALCNMSRATFVRYFAESVGRSASDVLTEIRMTLAARQLRHTDLSTGAVGEAVGYRSEAAFQRAFKQRMGLTPARWRTGT